MMKRVFLFIATNIAITLAVSVVLSLLGVGNYRLRGGGLDYTSLMASAALFSLPPIILFMFVQRHFVSGLSAGAVKG